MHKLLLAVGLLTATLTVSGQAATRHRTRTRHVHHLSRKHWRHRAHHAIQRRILLAPSKRLVIEKSPSHTKAAQQLKTTLKTQGGTTPRR